MANGDLADSIGIPILTGFEDKRLGYDAINAALDVIAAHIISGTHNASAINVGTLPLTRGGTGANDAAGALASIGAAAAAHNHTIGGIIDLATELAARRELTDGAFGSTPIYSPHGRTNPVTTSYVSAYLNSDGRIGATPSARKFKQDIQQATFTLEQINAIEVVIYRLKAAVADDPNADWEVGVIAEQLIDVGLSEFVVFDDQGEPFSVAYERLALVAIAGVQHLTAQLANINARLEKAGL